jgi:hypothetical protein
MPSKDNKVYKYNISHIIAKEAQGIVHLDIIS